MKELIRKIVEISGYTIVNAQEWRRQQTQKKITRTDLFSVYFSKVDPDKFFFVQIGANDGKTGDPIHGYIERYGLHGVAVEPIPAAFDSLKETYRARPEVTVVQAAIGSERTVLPFYSVKAKYMTKENFNAMTRSASFVKKNLMSSLRTKVPEGVDPETYVQETHIETITFPDLMIKTGTDRVDFLQIDAEGFDYEILKTVDLRRFRPEIINFESHHLSPQDLSASRRMLEDAGYSWFEYGSDTCAYRAK